MERERFILLKKSSCSTSVFILHSTFFSYFQRFIKIFGNQLFLYERSLIYQFTLFELLIFYNKLDDSRPYGLSQPSWNSVSQPQFLLLFRLLQLAWKCYHDSVSHGKTDQALAFESCLPHHLLLLSQFALDVSVLNHGFSNI